MPIISCFPTKSKNDDRYLQLVGGMMSGSINMGGQKITNVGAPANATDAVRQQDLEVVSQEVDHILDGTTPAYIPAATDAKIGGVIVGDNLSVDSNGTLSVDTDSTPTSGSVKPVQSGGVYTALQGYIPTSQKGTVSGVASLGSDGKVPASQLPEMDYVPNSQVGTAGGVAELDSTGKVPSSQLPSYVDDVEEYDTRSAFPGTGESGKIYVTKDTNLTYRWSGTEYVEISPSLALGETSATAYRGDRGKAAYDHSQITSGNPHGTTAADVGARPNTWMPSASDVGARPDTWTPTAEDVGALTQEQADERYFKNTGGKLGGSLTIGPVGQLTFQEDGLLGGIINSAGYPMLITSTDTIQFGVSPTQQLDDLVGFTVNSSRITATGGLSMGGNKVSNVSNPSSSLDAANKAYVDQKAPKYRTVTLPAASWSDNSQTVTVNGVKASETAQLIQPMPAVASQDAYIAAGVICSGQAANQLTFKCSTVPTEDLTLYVVLTEVSA